MRLNPLDSIYSAAVIAIVAIVFVFITPLLYETALPLVGDAPSQGDYFIIESLIWAMTYPLIGSLLWMITYHRRDELAELVMNIPAPAEIRQYLWLGVGMLIAAIGFSYLLFYPLSFIAPEFVQNWLLNRPTILYWDEDSSYLFANLAAIVMVVIFAPIAEEFIFRGYLLNRWTLKFGAWPATLLSSFLFAILHPDLLGAFIFAVLMCLLYMKTRSLIGPILVHFSNNLLAISLEWISARWSGFEPMTLQDFYDQAWLGVIGLLVGVPWLWSYSKRHLLPVKPLLTAHENGGEQAGVSTKV